MFLELKLGKERERKGIKNAKTAREMDDKEII
jgi:hypothetical protein